MCLTVVAVKIFIGDLSHEIGIDSLRPHINKFSSGFVIEKDALFCMKYKREAIQLLSTNLEHKALFGFKRVKRELPLVKQIKHIFCEGRK